MASKDKTSKTARVMNLLSKKADPVVEEPVEAAETESAAPAAPAPAPKQPPIVTSMAPDVAVSTQIRNALEDALEGELAQEAAAAPAPQPEPVVEEPSAPEPEPVQEEPPAPQPEPVVEEPPASQPEPAQEQASAPQSEQRWNGYSFPTYPGYINVMQVLVEEKAPKYVKMFGLCTCNRCMEDVKAITLNNLPSKYVVLEQGDLVPRLTVYETKFSSDITAQMLKACKMVMERPHHGR